jgi:hypothetical protein
MTVAGSCKSSRWALPLLSWRHVPATPAPCGRAAPAKAAAIEAARSPAAAGVPVVLDPGKTGTYAMKTLKKEC